MATREITDEQAGEIAERLEDIQVIMREFCFWLETGTAHKERCNINFAEIRRLLGFPV